MTIGMTRHSPFIIREVAWFSSNDNQFELTDALEITTSTARADSMASLTLLPSGSPTKSSRSSVIALVVCMFESVTHFFCCEGPAYWSAWGEWAIALVIFVEGLIALREYRRAVIENRTARMFEAVKYVEDSETRAARSKIYALPLNLPTDWWEKNPELAEVARTVCSRYNLLGAVTRGDPKLREFVVKEWAHNIAETYKRLKSYIAWRERLPTGRVGMYDRYKELNAEVECLPK